MDIIPRISWCPTVIPHLYRNTVGLRIDCIAVQNVYDRYTKIISILSLSIRVQITILILQMVMRSDEQYPVDATVYNNNSIDFYRKFWRLCCNYKKALSFDILLPVWCNGFVRWLAAQSAWTRSWRKSRWIMRILIIIGAVIGAATSFSLILFAQRFGT